MGFSFTYRTRPPLFASIIPSIFTLESTRSGVATILLFSVYLSNLFNATFNFPDENFVRAIESVSSKIKAPLSYVHTKASMTFYQKRRSTMIIIKRRSSLSSNENSKRKAENSEEKISISIWILTISLENGQQG